MKTKKSTAEWKPSKSCGRCGHLIIQRYDAYDEMLCDLMDDVIVLRKGQKAPDYCPLKKEREDREV